jgi:hypothetical protein
LTFNGTHHGFHSCHEVIKIRLSGGLLVAHNLLGG